MYELITNLPWNLEFSRDTDPHDIDPNCVEIDCSMYCVEESCPMFTVIGTTFQLRQVANNLIVRIPIKSSGDTTSSGLTFKLTAEGAEFGSDVDATLEYEASKDDSEINSVLAPINLIYITFLVVVLLVLVAFVSKKQLIAGLLKTMI